MKILILGGSTGFIGQNLVDYFAPNVENDISASCYNKLGRANSMCTYCHADLTTREGVEYILDRFEPDIVILAAAYTTSSKDVIESPWKHCTTNLALNSLVFELCHTKKVKHCIWFSCGTMYPSSDVPQKEDYCKLGCGIPKQYELVAGMKMYCESLAETYAKLGSCKYTSIRLSNVIGRFDKLEESKGHFFISTVKKIVDAKESILVWGPSQPEKQAKRDFVAVEDVCRLVQAVIEKQKSQYELFNCGCGVSRSIKDVVETIKRVAGRENLEVIYDSNKPNIPTDTSLDCSKAKELLGWEPRVSFEEGITRTLDYYKSIKHA